MAIFVIVREKIFFLSIGFAVIFMGCRGHEENVTDSNRAIAGQESHLNASQELRTEIDGLIQCLDNENAGIKQSAVIKLINLGSAVVPLLDKAYFNAASEKQEFLKIVRKGIVLKDRLFFSDELLESYPAVYLDFASEDMPGQFELFLKLMALDENGYPFYDVTDEDSGSLYSEFLIRNYKELTKNQKILLCRLARGPIDFNNGKLQYGWHKKITFVAGQLSKLLKDKDEDVFDEAIMFFAQIAVEDGIDSYVLSELNLNRYFHSEQIVQSIVLASKGKMNNSLKQCLLNKYPHIRAMAAEAIGDAFIIDAVGAIKPLLRDDSQFVRQSTVRSLAKLNAKEVMKDFSDLLKDENEDVRAWAGVGLSELGGDKSIIKAVCPELEKLYNDLVNNNSNPFYTARVENALYYIGITLEEIESLRKLKK